MSAWTPTELAELERLWLAGVITRKIGEVIGKGKNAVIGKAHKLNLPPRPSPIKRYAPGEAPPKRPPKPKKQPVQAFPPKKPKYRTAPGNRCQWPLWGTEKPTHEYCSAKTRPGSVYCEEHYRRAYRPVQELNEETRERLAAAYRRRERAKVVTEMALDSMK